jgi:hypothetical protein
LVLRNELLHHSPDLLQHVRHSIFFLSTSAIDFWGIASYG